MRRLRVFESISVDGYFTDTDDNISWAHAGREDPEFRDWVGRNAGSGGELLFGRKTYQMMEAYWPTSAAAQQMPEVAKGMNAAKKYVASKTIRPTWNNTHLLRGDLIQAVRDLKASPGPNIAVLGSGDVAAQLGEADLVDEYQLVVIPVALGGGRTVFTRHRELRHWINDPFAAATSWLRMQHKGSLVEDREHATLTFRRVYPHTPEKVWDAIATPDGLREWLMCTHAVIDGYVGGRFEMTSGPAGYSSAGRILVWEPPHVLEYEWNVAPVPEMPRGECATFRYELVRHGDATRVLVTYSRITKETARGFLPGLHAFLDRLAAQLDGLPLPEWTQRFSELQVEYPGWSGHAPATTK